MRRVSVGFVIAGLVMAGVLTAACAAPRNTLGTSASACFRSLPTAKAAVHQQGKFIGVRRMSAHRLEQVFHRTPPPGKEFCVVGFSGPFRAEQVDHPAGPNPGRYAVVVVTLRGTTTRQTLLVDRLPTRLRHR